MLKSSRGSLDPENTTQIAIDFGTTNTLVARWNGHHAECIDLLDVTVEEPTWHTPQVPSVLFYLAEDRGVIGSQAIAAREVQPFQGLAGLAPWTDRIKPELLHNSSAHVAEVDGTKITARQAATLFVETLLKEVVEQQSIERRGLIGFFLRLLRRNPIEHLTMTVPVECHEPYRRELSALAARLHIGRFTLLDEPVAAALGYGVDLNEDRTVLIVDFGGGTLNTAVVLTHVDAVKGPLGNRSTVLTGKGLIDFGGRTVDEWVAQAYLSRLPAGRGVAAAVQRQAEDAKISLSTDDCTEPYTISCSGAEASLTREEFVGILEAKGLYTRLDELIDQTLDELSQRHGIGPASIEAVLPVGGSTLLPNVRRRLMERFGSSKVWWDSPFDAVVKGAAIFGAGLLVEQIVHHDYAVRLFNDQTDRREYELLVPRGTGYPTKDALVSRVYTLAKGQFEFRVPIYEIGYSGRRSVPWTHRKDGQFWQPKGTDEERAVICLNVGDMIRVSPPGDGIRARLRMNLAIDAGRHLVLTITDLLTGKTLRKDEKVVQLR